MVVNNDNDSLNKMLRTQLMNYLVGDGMSLNQLSRLTRKTVKELESDLNHLEKSLKHKGAKLGVDPALCRKCGFEFPSTKLHKPSRCPECKATWIQEPKIFVKDKVELD